MMQKNVVYYQNGEKIIEAGKKENKMYIILEGEVEIVISGKPHRLKKGNMIIMPAREPHALKALKKFKMLLIMIRG